MDEALRQTLTITGISMGAIFGVMVVLYVAIRVMVRGRH